MGTITRRDFGKAAAVAAGAAALGGEAWGQQQQQGGGGAGANDRLRIGFIAVGNRGDQVLDAFLHHKDAQVVAVCDIWRPYAEFAAKKIRAKGAGDVELLNDYRRMLDRKDIDAVVVNTPDHWHALQTIHACQAGKDVYVEKPVSLTVKEGRAMVNAVRKHNRVAQVGIQRRSSDAVRQMVEFIRGGGIGKLTTIRAFHVQNEWPKGIGRPSDSEAPEGFDWDAWVGPAPMRPYNPNRTFYRFRWFYDFSGGQLTNFGTHYMDIAHWVLREDRPRQVAALGGKFADFDNREVPDTLEAMWVYPSGVLVTFTQINSNGAPAAARPCEMEFRGTQGTVYMTGRGWEVVPEVIPSREFPVLSPTDRAGGRGWRDGKPQIEPRTVDGSGDAIVAHVRNFLDCVKSRQTPVCDIETGHRSTSATLLGNVAHRAGALLEWDGDAERVTNHEKANDLLGYQYRSPYVLPLNG